MNFLNTKKKFGSISKLFHWIVSILMISMLVMGLVMTRMDRSAFRVELYGIHKSLGLTLLILIVARLLWRLINRVPTYPESIPKWEQTFARIGHWVLYLIILAMPLSGWLMSTATGHAPDFWHWGAWAMPGINANKTLAKTANQYHEILAYAVIVLVSLHVLMALKHHYLGKNNILRRMLPFTKLK